MTVDLLRTADTLNGLPCYEVIVDGVVIGTVFRKRTTWSRKPKGRRFVTARGTSDRYWSYLAADADPSAFKPTINTRREAVDRLLRERNL